MSVESSPSIAVDWAVIHDYDKEDPDPDVEITVGREDDLSWLLIDVVGVTVITAYLAPIQLRELAAQLERVADLAEQAPDPGEQT
jgi:hypothetical protein